MSGDNVVMSGMLQASRIQRAGMLLNKLQYTEHLPTTKNYPKIPKVEKLIWKTILCGQRTGICHIHAHWKLKTFKTA